MNTKKKLILSIYLGGMAVALIIALVVMQNRPSAEIRNGQSLAEIKEIGEKKLRAEEIKEINAYVRHIDINWSSYRTCQDVAFDFLTEGTFLVSRYDIDTLVKVEAEIFEKTDKVKKDIYVKDGDIVFMNSVTNNYDMPFYHEGYKIESTITNEYYFKDEELISWQREDVEIDPESEEYSSRAQQLKWDFKDLDLDALKEGANCLPRELIISEEEIREKWRSYANHEYGFIIEYPATVDGKYMKITQDENNFTVEGVEGVDGFEGHYDIPFTIGTNIRSEDDIRAFIKKRYGEACEFAEVYYDEPNVQGLYPVTFFNTYSEGGCWINWITLLLYSPEHEKILALDLGQEPPLMEKVGDEFLDYNNKLVESFRFIPEINPLVKTFTSRDKRLAFSYHKDWICREVGYGKRVDCYPTLRRGEEEGIGEDQRSVLHPDISIDIADCSASGEDIPAHEKAPDSREIYYFLKSYNGCRVLVHTEDEKTDLEEELDRIIFPDLS